MIAARWRYAGGLSSWHIVRPADPSTILCGRRVKAGERAAEPPGDERTCERCLLIAAKRNRAVAA